METRCSDCNKLLTDKNGNRLEDAIFDSTQKLKSSTQNNITYSLCEKCYRKREKC